MKKNLKLYIRYKISRHHDSVIIIPEKHAKEINTEKKIKYRFISKNKKKEKTKLKR